MTGNEILTEVRRLLYEASADLWEDEDILAHTKAEIRRLPTRGIYLEELWEISKEKNRRDYSLPSDTVDIEILEENYGTDSAPDWQEMKGWDTYAGALWLGVTPTDTRTIRVWIKKKFATIEETEDESEIPDDKIDAVIYGAAIRAYQQLIGYMVDQKNYDAIAKPDGISMNHVRAWIKDLQDELKNILAEIRGVPRPRSIDMVG